MKTAKNLLIGLIFVTMSLPLSAINLTHFGSSSSGGFSAFTVDTFFGFTTFGFTQGTSSIDLDGDDQDSLYGSFSSVDISSLSGSLGELTLSGSTTVSSTGSFTIDLIDSGGVNYARYTGGSFADISNSGITTLSFSSTSGAFDASNVDQLLITGGGFADPVEFSVTGLSLNAPVPEPETVALGLGLVALLGTVAFRRFR